ncbi:uncharacterized protein LOC119431589 [Dermacentor silvarum]|nr:uncharacterized protein LOC119431589 [Dermacentor silvarum]
MKAFIGFWGVVLYLATCDGSEVVEMSMLRQETKHDSVCDAARFAPQRELCDATFKLNIPHSHGDMKFICAVIGKYKMCLANAIQATGCDEKEFLIRQLQPMQQYIQESHIECIPEVNASSESRSPTGFRAKLDLCTRDKAWETQFLCAKKFHTKLRKIEDDKEVESHQICRSLSRYYSCLNTVLHSESCEEDTELMMHMEYFPKVLTQKYREMCYAELKLTAMNVAKRLEGYTQDHTCQEEDATKEFFACGLLFNEIVSHNPSKERICVAYNNFKNCTNVIEKDLHCKIGSEFHTHSMHVMNVLTSQYEHFCSSMIVNPEKPHIDGQSTEKPVGCVEDHFMEKYFECGLLYVYNLRDAMYGDNPQHKNQVCETIERHKLCLEELKKSSNCQSLSEIQASLDYLTNELHEAPGTQCSKAQYKRSGKIRFRSSEPKCHLREYAGTFFTCGTIFLMNTMPTPPSKDEDCRFYNQYLKCYSLLIPCSSPTDIKSTIMRFSQILTEGYEDKCRGINLTDTCDKLVLIKNFFSCGLTYYQSYNEFGSTYLVSQPHVCKLLEDFHNCSFESVFKNKPNCKETAQLFDNIKTIRDYVAKMFNRKHQSDCKAPADKDKRRVYLGLERQTTCDQFKAIKKLVLCGVTFHRMLMSVENGTHLKDNRTEVCPLVKEMKYCMYSATHDSGCSDALFLNTEISVLKKHLLMEFEDTCNALPSSEDQEFKVYRQACELKEFTQEWETCDTAMEDDISHFYRNGSAFRKTAISNRVRRRLCTDLIGYRKCLNDSADKHHCTAVAPQVAEMSNELFDRLGLIYCSGCSRRTGVWGMMALATAAGWLAHPSSQL